ncbi:MAG: hypothetical protein ONB23_12555 [candidate division KSB1 bacterium]|nr:hypothetical protein [candidate division KSB1 bacterium]
MATPPFVVTSSAGAALRTRRSTICNSTVAPGCFVTTAQSWTALWGNPKLGPGFNAELWLLPGKVRCKKVEQETSHAVTAVPAPLYRTLPPTRL